jgi:D-aminoacyl-tRNA deacylase
MIGLLQRVSRAAVHVADAEIAHIDTGLLILVGVERGDGVAQAARLAERLVTYRVFADEAGRMNRSVLEVGGSMLLVPQFTLAADTQKGTRPGFSGAAEPALGKELFERLVHEVTQRGLPVATGRFGADMAVSLVNDGPVTFLLRVPPQDEPPATRLP